MGDLSGGQILARAASKCYGLTGGQGTAFYRFDLIGDSPADVKAFKKSYRASLDELQLSAADADALVEEANAAFLMNMLIFEERDVEAGHLSRLRTLEEVQELVSVNRSALNFQRAYGAEPAKRGQCPFLPAKGDATLAPKACPWPFVWLHDPRSALVAHPMKNIGGLLAVFAVVRLALRYPRSTGLGLLSAIVACVALKPRKHSGRPH
jgi:hypothetical protein